MHKNRHFNSIQGNSTQFNSIQPKARPPESGHSSINPMISLSKTNASGNFHIPVPITGTPPKRGALKIASNWRQSGRVAERFNAPDSKSGVGVTLPEVRILSLPPFSPAPSSTFTPFSFEIGRMFSQKPVDLIRPLVAGLTPYTYGEQPKIKGLIKLNTNENPYPPSEKVLAATKAAVDGRLRLYPNPTADGLREKLARLHGCDVSNIIVGNGSDELLALAIRAFVEPRPNTGVWLRNAELSRATVQYFTPSYSLYPVLADINGSAKNPVPLDSDFALPTVGALKRGRVWNFQAALTLITTPNAPTGRGYETEELKKLCERQRGVVLLDEAYVDFARQNALKLALEFSHVLVARTFSKAYSLCFQRVGYLVGHPEMIAALNKIRDSYNVNGLGQVAAEATLKDLKFYQNNFKKILETRAKISQELSALGFQVLPSQTNFILVRPPAFSAQEWLQKLRNRKILVRWFKTPELKDYLRITIGTPEEMASLLKAASSLTKGS